MHVLIVGGGVIGLSTAYYCAAKGCRVTILERNGPDSEGCSYGNAGMIVPSHFIPLAAPGMVLLGLKWMRNPESPFYIKPRWDWDLFSWGLKFWRAANSRQVARAAPVLRDLSLASRTCFEELADLPDNDFGLVKKGLFMLCKFEETLHEESKTAALANQLGIPAEVLDARQTASLDPHVHMDIAGSVYFPKDCHLVPSQFMAGMRTQLQKAGVAIEWNQEVTGWQTNSKRIQSVRTLQGEVSADEYVLCGGSWSPKMVMGLSLNLPMQAGKGYSVTIPKPRQLPEICAVLAEARVAVTPMAGSLRVGGTMEIAGLNEEINPARVLGIIKAFSRYYPEFKTADLLGLPVWHGLRPCSPDGLPYVGRTKRYSNLSVAAGHAMMGLSLGPITGKLISEILSDEKPCHDITILDPDRYN